MSRFLQFLGFAILFTAGSGLGAWYAASILVPIFYGLPKALGEYCGGRLTSVKPVLGCLFQPIIITLAVFVASFVLTLAWPALILYLARGPAFLFGNACGTVFAILNLIFSKKTHADMFEEYEALVRPYRKI